MKVGEAQNYLAHVELPSSNPPFLGHSQSVGGKRGAMSVFPKSLTRGQSTVFTDRHQAQKERDGWVGKGSRRARCTLKRYFSPSLSPSTRVKMVNSAYRTRIGCQRCPSRKLTRKRTQPDYWQCGNVFATTCTGQMGCDATKALLGSCCSLYWLTV